MPSPLASHGSEFRGLCAAGRAVSGELGPDHAEQARCLAAGQPPVLCGVCDDLDESEVRVAAVIEPRLGGIRPQFINLGLVVDELHAPGHRQPVARLSDADIDFGVRLQRLRLVAVEGEEEPDVGILGDLLGAIG